MIIPCNDRFHSSGITTICVVILLFFHPGSGLGQSENTTRSTRSDKPASIFYSRMNGNWETPATWSNNGHNGNAATTVPSSSDIVNIGDGISYFHEIRVTSGSATCSNLALRSGSSLDVGTTIKNNFGVISADSHGNLKISSSGSTAVFPSGNFNNFLGTNGGQVEYYSTGNQNYILPSVTSSPNSTTIAGYCFLKFSPSPSRDIIMANTNLNVHRDMIVKGTDVTAKVKLNNISESQLNIYGHLNIISGGLQFQNFNNKALTMIVDSNVIIASGAAFDLEHTGPGANNTLTIGGNLFNDGIFDMSYSQAQRAYPVTFTGSANTVIDGSGSVTDFYAITLNKGNSQASVLEIISDNFSFSNNLNPLTLENGTFKVTSPVTISVSENEFIIPRTACLAINGGFVTAVTGLSNEANVKTDGRISVSDGALYIGTPGSGYGNDILYTTTNTAEIDISGGILEVNGQICREDESVSAALKYSQSAGSIVTIYGYEQTPEHAKLEVLNPESNFIMDGGTLRIVNGAGTTFYDLWLNPEHHQVNGGTTIFGNSSTATQNGSNLFRLYATCPLFHLTIDGTANPKTVTLMSPDLNIRGNLTIQNTSFFKSNGEDIVIEGNCINDGTFSHDSASVFFNGNTTISGISTTRFYNMTVMPEKSLTGKGSGDVEMAGNWENNGTFIHNNGTLIFSGSNQVITGTSPTAFYNMTISPISSTRIQTSGQTLAAILLVNGTLLPDDNLTLLSTATSTALVDGSGTGSIEGDIAMQRYLSRGYGYKYIATPFLETQVEQLAPYIDLEAVFPRLYWYNEAKELSGWEVFVYPDNIMSSGTGFAANFGESNAPLTFQLSGPVFSGTYGPVTLYNNNYPFTTGFNLFGNPFPSPLDWESNEGWIRENIDDALYYFNAGTTDIYTGTYSSYINGVSSDGIAGPVIPSMQACFIHVSDGKYPVSSTLQANKAARSVSLNPAWHKTSVASENPRLTVFARYSDGSYSDPAILYFDPNASVSFDRRFDALKLINTDPAAPSLYTFSAEHKKLSINAMPPPSDSIVVIPLGITALVPGYLALFNGDNTMLSEYPYCYLADYKTIKLYPMISSKPCHIQQTNKTEDTRFALILSKKALDMVPLTEFSSHVYASGNTVFTNLAIPPDDHITVNIYALTGQLVNKRVISVSGSYQYDTGLPKGIYILQIVGTSKQKVVKIAIGF